MSSNEDPLLGWLNDWERDHPQQPFGPALDEIKDEFTANLHQVPLLEIRRKHARYAKCRAALLAGHQQLKHMSSLSPVRRFEREFALYEAFIDAAESEIARRSRSTESPRMRFDAPAVTVQREQPQKPKIADPDVAKRRALVKANLGNKASEICEIFDRQHVPLPDKWQEAGFQEWGKAYKDSTYRRRIDVLIAKDRRSP